MICFQNLRSLSVLIGLFVIAMGCATTPDTEDRAAGGADNISEAQYASFAAEAADYELAYRLSPTTVRGSPAMEVELHFHSGDQRSTELMLPHRWANVSNYYQGIVGLEVMGENTHVVRDDFVTLRVDHPPDTPLVIRYQVVQTFEGALYFNRYRPIFGEDHFQFMGYGVFVVPDIDPDTTRSILLKWADFDVYEQPLNSHGLFEDEQNLQTDIRSLLHAVYLGGDFETKKVETSGAPIYFAFRGDNWPFEKQEFTDKVVRIVEAQRKFFDDPGPEHLLVTLYPGDEYGHKMGTAVHHAVVLRLLLDEDFSWTPLLELTAHEVLHLWNGEILRRAEPQENYYWFSEGFTDFFTARLLLREAMIDLEQYAEIRNRQLVEYEFSPVRDLPSDEIATRFWNDPDSGRLPYLRGALLALKLDAAIKLDSHGEHSLDDAMVSLIEKARHDGTRFSTDLLAEVTKPLYSEGIKALEEVIDTGSYLAPHPAALGPCVELETVDAGPANFGFDVGATRRQGKMNKVDPHGPAYEAGLRDGQRVESFRFHQVGHIAVGPVHIHVQRDDDSPLEVSYLPTDSPRTLSLYSVDEEQLLDNRAQCRDWFESSR